MQTFEAETDLFVSVCLKCIYLVIISYFTHTRAKKKKKKKKKKLEEGKILWEMFLGYFHYC